MYPPILRVAIVLACLQAANGQVDVLTANYDTNRTSANLQEGILNTSNVNPTQFGKIATYALDGQLYGQPLYVHTLSIPGHGSPNVVFVATMHNSVYALDADAAGGTAPLWQINLGPSVDPLSFVSPTAGAYGDILHEIGILSTPVIDRTGGTIYVVSEILQSGTPAFYLHALDLTTGNEKLNGPVEIQATVQGTGWGGLDPQGTQLPFFPSEHIQRPGLLLANGMVYIAFGSHGDFSPWHGWIMAYNATDLRQQTAVFCTTPDDAGSSVWQGGRGLVADPSGEIYATTGNGTYDGIKAWGESILHLSPALSVADWFTPAQFTGWNDDDADLGSSGPILIPGTNLLVAGGKPGLVVVVDRTNMGHEMANNPQAVQTFQAVPIGKFAIYNAALWNRSDGPMLYIWGYEDALRAFQMQNGVFNSTAVSFNGMAQNALPFSGLTVSSNGITPGSGILWATTPTTAQYPGPGTLHAFDATDVTRELWNSDVSGARDALGNFTKMANPTVADGKVFVPTDSKQLTVYGLLPVPGITAVVNGASFTSSPVAPGEIVTIFGNDLGPSVPASLTLDAQGKVATTLAGVTVAFDGAAVPLLYVSAGQINAVAPFELSGKSSTELQVTTPGSHTFSVTLPVGAAAPSIFAGASGQGAILNADLTVNSPSNPAASGSTIAIFATGTGTLNPIVPDGAVVTGPGFPASAMPVTVSIGGQSATVGYQGAAPGFVAGVMQINAQIPTGIAASSAVPVTLAVGSTGGLNTVTVAVK